MNLVFTICIGDTYHKIGALTHASISSYASKIGAEFLIVNEFSSSTPHWEKFQIYNLLNKYERIIYFDSDIIIRDDCPDLFKIVPKNSIGLFNEAPFTDGRIVSMNQAIQDHKLISLEKWNGKYYNTGVMIVSRIHKYLFKRPAVESCNFYEQGYLNLVIAKDNPRVFDLTYKFNRMACMDRLTGEERHASYIIHYAGFPDLNQVLSLIPGDLAKLEQNKPEYRYQRHILIDVQGGLGDQVQAEPAIRFLKKNVYPDDEVVVKTHFPRLFSHLDVPVYEHSDFVPKPDTPYYHPISLPGPNMVQWSVVSNLLCHTVDYISMALMRRTLPNIDKQIKLQVYLEDVSKVLDVVGVQDLNSLVLVHPGRHWQSKTFPVKWWNEVIYGLIEKGLRVCLIGMDEDTRGVLDVDVPDGVIDTRNLLDLGGMIAIISAAGILISNDSAPIHIAGAFDNWIILIPTCKHPDHLLPWRNGSQSYKAVALYQKLVIDDIDAQPTSVHGVSGEFVNGNIMDYLPKVADIITECTSILQEYAH